MSTLRNYMKTKVDKWFKQDSTLFIQWQGKQLIRLYGENLLRWDMVLADDLLDCEIVEVHTLVNFMFIDIEFDNELNKQTKYLSHVNSKYKG